MSSINLNEVSHSREWWKQVRQGPAKGQPLGTLETSPHPQNGLSPHQQLLSLAVEWTSSPQKSRRDGNNLVKSNSAFTNKKKFSYFDAWLFLTTFKLAPNYLLLLLSRSVVSDSVQPHRRQPPRLRRPWDSPGKNTGVGCHFLLQCMKVKSEREVTQSCLTPSDPMDCSPPDFSIHGIFQARVLEWGAIAQLFRRS